MRKETYTSKGITWERVPRNKAKKAYGEGHWITLYPVNLRPRTICNPPIPIRNDCGMTAGMTFEAVVNEFEYYNCNRETGRYAKFFMEV